MNDCLQTGIATACFLASFLLLTVVYAGSAQASANACTVAKTAIMSSAADTAVVTEPEELPAAFALHQNYPNPFNPVTRVRYEVPQTRSVQLVVYNMLGQKLTTLVEGMHRPGNYEVTFDGSRLTSGVYILSMKAGESFHAVRRMVLSK